MAILKDLTVLGSSRWLSDSFGTNITANAFIKTGGTASQFLKADGSVDNNTYALSSALGSYLPLTGGTITSNAINPLILNSTNTEQKSTVDFKVSGTIKAAVGWHNASNIGAYLQNLAVSGYPYVNIASDGKFKYKNTYEFYHSNNSNLATVSWSALNLSAAGTLSVGKTSTFTGAATFNNNITLGGSNSTIYFGRSGMAAPILAYGSSYTKFGIWYHDLNYDAMTFSASNNADTIAGADFAIQNDKLYARGNVIYHAGNSNLSTVNWATANLNVAGTSTLTGAVTANSKISTFDDIYLKRLESGQSVNYGQIGFQKIGNSFYTFFTVPAFSINGDYGGPGLLILTDPQGISSLKYTDNFATNAQESDSYEIWHGGNSNRNTKNWAAKNLSAAGTLSVTSTSTLTGAVTCSNNLSVASGLVTARDLTVTRNLVIPKTAPVSAVSGNYYLYVNPSGSYSE